MIYKYFGSLAIFIGLAFNQYLIMYVTDFRTTFDTAEKSYILILIQLIIISIGIYIFLEKKKAIQNLSLLFITCLVFLILLEIALSFPMLQQLKSNSPLWIPSSYKKYNLNIYNDHKVNSKKNEYGFNDTNHSLQKQNAEIRIAVLGDSFTWGTGVPDSVIWINKLEKAFKRDGVDCTILNWGKVGWSTLDQYNFLKSKGVEYQFDNLVFAFVVNDPVLDSSFHRQIFNQGGFVDEYFLQQLSRFFPNSILFLTGLIENIASTYFDYGYIPWIKKLYHSDNLQAYEKLLKEIKQYCNKNSIKFSFILTPENHSPTLGKYLNIIEKLLKKNRIEYLNLYRFVKEELNEYSDRELWANPGDGHPGSLVTEVYVKYIYPYLKKKLKITTNYNSYQF